MPIFKGDNWQHLYKGDGHPAALYKGSKKLAGWTEESQAGVSHAYFDDTYNDKADVTINGKSTQVVTTGKNLLPSGEGILKMGQPYVSRGRTYTLNSDGSVSITTQDTSSSTGNIFLFGSNNDKKYYKLPPGDYRCSTSSNINVSIQLTDSEGNNTRVEGGSNFSLKLLEGECIAYVWLYGVSGTDWNETIYPQLERGNVTTSYEPYTGGAPSPSPDYPQEITSVGDSGSVEVVSTGENLYAGGDIQDITQELSKKISVPCPGAPLIIKAVFVPVSGEPNSYANIEYYDSENNRLGINGVITEIGTQNTDFVYHAKGLHANNGVSVDMTDVKKIIFTFMLHSSGDGEYDAREIMVCTDRNESEAMFSGYQSSTATFSTPNGLPGIPVESGGNYTDADGQQWICDEIDTKAGVYRQRVAKKTVSIERITRELEDRGVLGGVDNHINNSPVTSNAICDRSIYSKSYTSGTFYINKNANAVFIFEGVYSEQSLEEAKELFDGATVLYAIDPVETPLSDAVDTFLGGTNLFVSEHEMDVTVKTEDQANPTGA